MDGRGTVRRGLFLLLAAAGCQHQVTTLSPTGAALPPVKQEQRATPIVVNKAASSTLKELPPAVLVAWGDFKAGEAFGEKIPPARQQELRDAARQDYEQALRSDPKNVPAYQGLARLHTAARNHDRAIETYQRALQIAPRSAPLWYELGMCHNYQRHWGPALECLERAAQLDPNNRACTNALGIVLAESGRYGESLTCFVRSSGEAMGYLRLAQTLQRLQQPELSRQYLEVALQKDPSLAQTLHPDGNTAPSATIQQTSYQAPSAPPVQEAPPPQVSAPAPIAAPKPQVIRLDTPAVQEQPKAPQPINLPPPPADNLQFSEPEH